MVAGGENTGQAMRHSTRVPAEIAVRVRSLDPGFNFEEQCKTLLVNAQGCGFQCSRQLPVGIAVLLTIDGRQATATVLNATSLGETSGAWVIGAKLHQSGNFWGLASPPPDWAALATPPSVVSPQPAGVDQYIEERVTAAIQRQTEKAMAALRSEVDRLVAASETDFLSRIVQESSATAVEMVHRLAEQETESIHQTFRALSEQFQNELQLHSERQVAAAEQRLREVQTQLSASGQERIEAATVEIMNRMRLDAKRLSESAIAQWNSAFEQTLQMLPELVRQNLKSPEAAVTHPRH